MARKTRILEETQAAGDCEHLKGGKWNLNPWEEVELDERCPRNVDATKLKIGLANLTRWLRLRLIEGLRRNSRWK